MSRNLLEAAERIAEELSSQERRQLAQELMRGTRRERWNRLLQSINQKAKGQRVLTMDEINAEVAAVRRLRRHARAH